MLPRIVVFVVTALATSQALAGVEVERFTTSTEQPGTAWIGKAIADGLAADLADVPNAASHRIGGSYQNVGTQIRVHGHVLDREGTLLATFRATGNTEDLFHLEDALADAARKAIVRANRPSIARAPTTTPSIEEDRTPSRLVYSGPLRSNPRMTLAPKLTDPNARASTWRYYYSSPIFNWTWNYGYCGGYYGGYYGGWCGRRYGFGYRFGGRPAFIFGAYQGSQNTY